MNRTKNRVRRLLPCAVAAALMLVADFAAAAAPDYAALGKDVRILGKVLEESTAVDSAESRGRRGRAHIDGLYLAGQGMLFQVRLGGEMHFTHGFFEAPLPPGPPIPPVPPTPAAGAVVSGSAMLDGEDMLIETGEISVMVDEAMDDAMDSLDDFDMQGGMDKQARAELRTLREAQTRAARDYAQRQRAWAEALRDGKNSSQAERDKLRAELERSHAQLEASRQQMRARVDSLRAEQRKQWQARVQQAESALLDALCSYAGSARRLGANEHVSLVIEDAEDGRRRVWVVRKADLDACAGGNQSGDFLQKKALSYLM
jgi:hypothetical protein